MNALEHDMLHGQRLTDDLHCFAVFQCNAELAVDLAGADKIMGMCIDAWLDAEGDIDRFLHLLCHTV